MVWGKCVGSLLLGNECAAVEVSAYFCRLSFQGPDWQLFLELESHSLLNRMSGEKGVPGGGGGTNMHAQLHMHMSMPRIWTPTHMHAKCRNVLTHTFFETVANNWHTNVTYSHSCIHTCTSACARVCTKLHLTHTHTIIHDTADTFMTLWDVLLQRGMVRDVH